jgi:hypothetical protein
MILQRLKQAPNFFVTFCKMSLLAWLAQPLCLLKLLGSKSLRGSSP